MSQPQVVTHGACGKSWIQRGDRTSHCPSCHDTFAALRLFDLHRRNGTCVPPATIMERGEWLERDAEGVWTSPGSIKNARKQRQRIEQQGLDEIRHSTPTTMGVAA